MSGLHVPFIFVTSLYLVPGLAVVVLLRAQFQRSLRAAGDDHA